MDTAATKAPRADGSRGLRATSAVTWVEASDGPTTAVPVGRVGVGPASRTEGAVSDGAAPAVGVGPPAPSVTAAIRPESAAAATVTPRPCRVMGDSLAYSAGGRSSPGSGSGVVAASGRSPARHAARRSPTTASWPRSLGS